MRKLPLAAAALLGLALLLHPRTDHLPVVVSPREREASIVLTGRDGARPVVAVAGFGEPTDPGDPDPAVTVASTLRFDSAFEGVFDLVAPGALRAPVPERPGDAALEAWRQTGADGLLVGAVRQEVGQLLVEARLYDLDGGELAFARAARGPADNPRAIAHLLAHELLADQAGLPSVTMTHLAFVSDRAGSRREPTGFMRRIKEIYVSDYDGANQRAADGRRGPRADAQLVARRPGHRLHCFSCRVPADPHRTPRRGPRRTGSRRAWQELAASLVPDGQRLAFTSNRDGNEEIYVMRADGSETPSGSRTPANRHLAGMVA